MEDNKNRPLYGLILAGGKSLRMQQDKSLLQYHGKSQIHHCFDLLSLLCEKIFISNRKEQENLKGHGGLTQIHDLIADIGPLGGILSALTEYPKASWLVLACDLPFVNGEMLKTLIKSRDPSKIATAYRSDFDGLPDPLCAVYEPECIPHLLKSLSNGQTCPRKILMNSNAHLIEPKERGWLANINCPEEYHQAKHKLADQNS